MELLTIDTLAETLQEPNCPLLTQVLRTLGQDRCSAILADTLQCEANGGMLIKDGSRRRTPGGVFFQLVKERATARERRQLFPRPAAPHTQAQRQVQPQALPQILTWDEVHTLIEMLVTAPAGEARTMKLTLIGRPGKIEAR
jgi:PHAX RNA-binding domain-containing protein